MKFTLSIFFAMIALAPMAHAERVVTREHIEWCRDHNLGEIACASAPGPIPEIAPPPALAEEIALPEDSRCPSLTEEQQKDTPGCALYEFIGN